MGETWGIILELLQVILLLATVPARLAWPMLTSGSVPRVFFGAGMLIAVYGGLLAAIARGVMRLIVRRTAPPPRPRADGPGHNSNLRTAHYLRHPMASQSARQSRRSTEMLGIVVSCVGATALLLGIAPVMLQGMLGIALLGFGVLGAVTPVVATRR